MVKHSIFYYPYASFKDDQVSLLKAAALYFDKLYILDPLKACWGMIGPGGRMHELRLLEQEGILERVAPEEVLKEYEEAIAAEIIADMKDAKFLSLCQRKGRGGRWTLALAKVPKAIRDKYSSLDMPMRRLMRDIPEKVASQLEDYEDGPRYGEGYVSKAEEGRVLRLCDAYHEVRQSTDVYDEYRETNGGMIEYRYADYPLSLGEAVMINHALFGGFLHTGAVPLTDDVFHNRALNLKIKRAACIPEIRDILDDRAKQRQLKKSQLAMSTLTDLDLAIISPEMAIEEILKYRDDNADALGQAREELALLAREVQHQPWTEGFANELETKAIPKVQRMLREGKKARNSWLKSKRGRMILKAAGITLGTAGATISIVASLTPLLPVAVATGALGLAGGSAIPAIEWMMDWREGKAGIEENGLHYLINIKRGQS
ncbi:MAG: hypothetical protein ACETWQ_00965 [Phycisphaerae bacterium]